MLSSTVARRRRESRYMSLCVALMRRSPLKCFSTDHSSTIYPITVITLPCLHPLCTGAILLNTIIFANIRLRSEGALNPDVNMHYCDAASAVLPFSTGTS